MSIPTVQKVLIIGLDCAAPRFVFGPDAFDLPNIRELMARGRWGELESCHPPITVPAWASMTSSKDPGTLGCYGFRNRPAHTYEPMVIATAQTIREPRLWDILSRAGKKVIVLGVPQTFPVRPVNGCMVGCFLTPDTRAAYTYPKALKEELIERVGEYVIDVKDFRTDEKGPLLERIYALMENRFAYARYLMTEKPWDFFMMVEMGVDRLHHAFWRFCDPQHPRFEPGNPYRNVFRDYYQAVDSRIGELLELTDENTAVFIVSDHGARAMIGGVCVNQWLLQEGLLALREVPSEPARFEDCEVDWARTKAWSSGGYYARIFVNVEGREPQGIVKLEEYDGFCNALKEKLEAMRGPDGALLGTRAYRPHEIYRQVKGVAPDLLVYFGNLAWRAVGTVGTRDIFTVENDTGPDDANHDFHGIFVMDDGRARGGAELRGLQIMDVAPAVLRRMGLPAPDDMQGRGVPGLGH